MSGEPEGGILPRHQGITVELYERTPYVSTIVRKFDPSERQQATTYAEVMAVNTPDRPCVITVIEKRRWDVELIKLFDLAHGDKAMAPAITKTIGSLNATLQRKQQGLPAPVGGGFKGSDWQGDYTGVYHCTRPAVPPDDCTHTEKEDPTL